MKQAIKGECEAEWQYPQQKATRIEINRAVKIRGEKNLEAFDLDENYCPHFKKNDMTIKREVGRMINRNPPHGFGSGATVDTAMRVKKGESAI